MYKHNLHTFPPWMLQDPYGSSGAPLWQTATFAQPSATTFGEFDYTRSGNPTRTMLEVSMLYNGL